MRDCWGLLVLTGAGKFSPDMTANRGYVAGNLIFLMAAGGGAGLLPVVWVLYGVVGSLTASIRI